MNDVRRYKIIDFDGNALLHLCNGRAITLRTDPPLPDDARAVGVIGDPLRNRISLCVESASFDSVPDGLVPPNLYAIVSDLTALNDMNPLSIGDAKATGPAEATPEFIRKVATGFVEIPSNLWLHNRLQMLADLLENSGQQGAIANKLIEENTQLKQERGELVTMLRRLTHWAGADSDLRDGIALLERLDPPVSLDEQVLRAGQARLDAQNHDARK